MFFIELFIIAIFIYIIIGYKTSQNNNSENNIESENFNERNSSINKTILEYGPMTEIDSSWEFYMENLDTLLFDIFSDFFAVLNKNHKFLDNYKEEFDSICKNKKFVSFDHSNLFLDMKTFYCVYKKKKITKKLFFNNTSEKKNIHENPLTNKHKECKIIVINCLNMIKKFYYYDLYSHKIDWCKDKNGIVENDEIYKKICQFAFYEIFISDEEAILTCMRYLQEIKYQESIPFHYKIK